MTQYVCQSDTPMAQGQTCETWAEYTPVLPELTNEGIGIIWLWFFMGLFIAWGGKKLIRLFGA